MEEVALVVLGVLTVAVLGGVVVWSGLDHNTSWPLALGRLLLAAGLGGVSACPCGSRGVPRPKTGRSCVPA